MTLKTKPRNSYTPWLVDVYDADMPEGTARIVARCNTKTGDIFRTKGAAAKASMPEIREALKATL